MKNDLHSLPITMAMAQNKYPRPMIYTISTLNNEQPNWTPISVYDVAHGAGMPCHFWMV